MSRRYPWEFERPAPKRPPPAHGIRMQKAGATWWGRQWIEALFEVLGADAGRLSRGRTYARAGRTHDLVVEPGKVTARVTGSRAEPYEVAIELACFDERAWRSAIAAMAKKAQFAAELLEGRMPPQIDEAFHSARRSLFPRRRGDLTTRCSCPDWGDPCKHVAATHYVLGEALDRDPFLLFELRGRTREQVLSALRDARGKGEPRGRRSKASAGQAQAGSPPAEPEIPTVDLGRVTAADYEKPRTALPALRFSFDEPVAHGALLRQLGAPVGWTHAESPADVLGPAVRAAAEAARRIALGDEVSAPAGRDAARRPGRR